MDYNGVGYLSESDNKAVGFEQNVIGAVVLDSESLTEVADILKPEYFYDSILSEVFAVVMKMYDAGNPIDLYTVCDRYQKVFGTISYAKLSVRLIECTQRVGTGAHVKSHALIVKQHYVSRQLTIIAASLNSLASDPSIDISTAIEYLSVQADLANSLMVNGNHSRGIKEVVKDALKRVEDRIVAHNEGRIIGISTGLLDLDRALYGWQKGDLIVLGARPSMGKTALMLHFAKVAAQNGIPVCIFSLEMTDIALADRLLLAESMVDSDNFRSGDLSDEEIMKIEQAGSRLSHLPITIDPTPAISMRQAMARAKLLQRQGKCELVMFDYLQLATDGESRSDTREREVGRMSNQAKSIAKNLNVPVILLSQLNRAFKDRSDKMPQLSDLRDSGSIEQDADVVLFLHRPAYYGELEFDTKSSNLGKISAQNLGVLNIAKQRNGEVGWTLFNHNSSMTKMYDWRPFDFHNQNYDDNTPF